MRLRGSLAGLGALVLALAGCITESRQAGRGSEVENEVVGALVTDGGVPVAGAKVTALPATGIQARDPAAGAAKPESVFTDSAGRYRLADLAAGDYNLLGDYDHGKLVVLIPGVQQTQDARRLDLGVDTLRAPGGIRDRILLNGEGRVGVLCYIPGTSNIAISDDSGLCSLEKVPQGSYTVRYSLPGFLVDPDTGVKVVSGRITELAPKSLVYDPALPPPAPKNLRIAYDFRTGTITLTWPPVPVSDLDGYVIYMDQPGKVEPQPRSTSIVRDTTFTDTVTAPTGSIRQVVYRVKARDKNADLSVSYSPAASAEVLPADRYTPKLAWVNYKGTQDSVAVGDTLTLILGYGVEGRGVKSISWFAGKDTLAKRISPVPSGTDTLRFAAKASGKPDLSVELIDEWGGAYTLRRDVMIFPVRLLAAAGPDTVVSIKDTVRLRGQGAGFPVRVTYMEWDIGGTGSFKTSQDGSVAFIAPDTDADIRCVLRVAGADGSVAFDTLNVHVVKDPPKADAGPDRFATQHDTVTLSGSGSDGMGRIIQYAWLAYRDSVFREGPARLQVDMSMQSDTLQPYVLRVTDDDGNTALDTVFVHLTLDSLKALAGADREVSIRDSIRLEPSAGGAPVVWEWDIGGTGTFRAAPRGRVSFVAPDTAGVIACILRLRDRSGATALDTLQIRVVLDAPVAACVRRYGIFPFAGDTVYFSAAASKDGYGSIRKYEWDRKGDGNYVELGAEAAIATESGDAGKTLRLRLRVTDDDGLTDTVSVAYSMAPVDDGWCSVYLGTPILKQGLYTGAAAVFNGDLYYIGGHGDGIAHPDYLIMDSHGEKKRTGANLPIGRRMGHALLTHAGKLWVIGGGIGDASVWNTADGFTWSKVADSVPFGTRANFVSYVFQGRMWVVGGWDDVSPNNFHNDVWSSENGKDWTLETTHAAFAPRAYAAGFQFGGKLWMTGGVDNATAGLQTEIWNSLDGRVWELAGTLPGSDLHLHQHVVHNGKIWLLLHSMYPGARILNSVDGIHWNAVDDEGSYEMGVGFSAVEFAGHIWAMGDHDPSITNLTGIANFRVVR